MPGLASTEGDRPPTNPVIRVRFPPPPKQMDISFSPWHSIMRDPDLFETFSSERGNFNRSMPSTGQRKRSLHLSCMKKELSLQIGPMTLYLREWKDIILYYANLQTTLQPTTIPAHKLNLRWSKSVDWK